MKRGAVKKADSKLINVWMPTPMVTVMDQAVHDADTDRAKFIRLAIREKIQSIKGAR